MNSGTRVAQAALLAGAAALAWGGTSRATVIPTNAYYGDTFTTTAGVGGAPNMDSRNTSPEINNTGTDVSWTSDVNLASAYPHTYYGYAPNDPAGGVNPTGASTGALAMADFGSAGLNNRPQGTLLLPIPDGVTKFVVSADIYPFQTDIGSPDYDPDNSHTDQYLGLVLTQTSNGNSDSSGANNTRVTFYNYPVTNGAPDDTVAYASVRQLGNSTNNFITTPSQLPNGAVYRTDQFNQLSALVDLAADTVEVFVNGTSIYTYDLLPGTGANLKYVGLISLAYTTRNLTNPDRTVYTTGGYVDNFFVAPVPEPAMLSVLGLGGIMSLGRRRKTRK